MKGANFLLISFIGVVITSCIGLKNSQQAIMFDKSYCNKQIIPTYNKEVMPKPIWQLNLDSNLTNSFSFQSLNIANAFGMLDDLRNYTSLTANYNLHPTSEQKLSLIESLQQIHQKINIASLEVSAITSELDCEEERAGQFAYYLKEREGRTENKLIISSIIIGAIGAISAEAVSSSKTAGGITIGGSIIEASLGVMMLVNKRKIEFNHTLNALSDIWTNPTVS
ncbi:MAG: hypothetical protein IT235_05075 [Bacteroidia bacterium]|nr:hypothetical protein [Bacteroidia bacterium]